MGSLLTLIISGKVKERIKEIVKYAEAHRVDFETLMSMKDYGNPGYTGPIPAGLNQNNTMKIYDIKGYHYYKIAYTIEQMEQLWVRHFSASVSTNEMPNLKMLMMCLPDFGFKECNINKLYVEPLPPALHILEPLDMTWEEFTKKYK